MPLRRVNPQRKLEAAAGPLDELFAAEPSPGPEKPVIGGFVNPFFRLDQEMKKRGISKHVGYTTADAHYERKVHEVSWIIEYGEKKDWPVTWTQQFWLFDKGGGKWEACWNENPAMSRCAPPFATVDEAVDQIIKWADTPHRVDQPPTPEELAELRLDQELRERGFTPTKKKYEYTKAEQRAWLAEPWKQIKTWGAYYAPDTRSSEFVAGGATFDEAIDALLRRLDLPEYRPGPREEAEI